MYMQRHDVPARPLNVLYARKFELFLYLGNNLSRAKLDSYPNIMLGRLTGKVALAIGSCAGLG